MRCTIRIMAIAAAVTFAAPQAFADEVRSASVVASASDFATPEARAALDQRVKSAAEEVCGANAAAEGVSWASIQQCRVEVRADIYRKVASLSASDSARLTAR